MKLFSIKSVMDNNGRIGRFISCFCFFLKKALCEKKEELIFKSGPCRMSKFVSSEKTNTKSQDMRDSPKTE